MDHVDVAVVGGGVIGLSCAFALAERGLSVSVFDDTRQGRATRAAAGMLAPLAEADGDGFFVRRGAESLAQYPDYLDQIADASGKRVELYGPGLLRIARTEEAELVLCRRLTWQLDLPLPQVRLSRMELLALEPNLPQDVRAGALSFQERHLRPRALHEALAAACVNRRVTIVPATGRLAWERGRVAGVAADGRTTTADRYLIAGGVWSSSLLAELGLADGAVYPVKGQACSVAFAGDSPTRHTVYTHEVYIVPRPGGEILIGATQEPESGYDADVAPEKIDRLRKAAGDFIHGLADLPVTESWAGLRPFSKDGLPIVGPVPAHDNVFAAAGHGRNGILFAPLTSRLIASAIVDGGEMSPEIDPGRFAQGAS